MTWVLVGGILYATEYIVSKVDVTITLTTAGYRAVAEMLERDEVWSDTTVTEYFQTCATDLVREALGEFE